MSRIIHSRRRDWRNVCSYEQFLEMAKAEAAARGCPLVLHKSEDVARACDNVGHLFAKWDFRKHEGGVRAGRGTNHG